MIAALGENPGPFDRGRRRRLVGAALPQAAARRDRAAHPADRVPLGLHLLGRGRGGVALTPWAYVAGSIISLVVFARNRNFAFLRTAQFLLILVAPALGMIMLGGLEDGEHGDPVVASSRRSARLPSTDLRVPGPGSRPSSSSILLVLVLSEVVRPDGADLPEAFVRTFDVLNIVAVSFVAMLLLITFARGRETAQARVEALLLNILPEEIAQRLQAEPAGDRGPLRRRQHPLRGRRRLHSAREPTRRARGRRDARSSVHDF